MNDSDATATQTPPNVPAHLPATIFEELDIARDPGNLFHQTIEQVLLAADLVGLAHHQQIIIAQPKNEIMVHFPVLMDDNDLLMMGKPYQFCLQQIW